MSCLNTRLFEKVGPMVSPDRNVSCVMSDKQICLILRSVKFKTHKTQTFVEIDHGIISTVILLPLSQDESNCEFVTFPLVSWVRCGT